MFYFQGLQDRIENFDFRHSNKNKSFKKLSRLWDLSAKNGTNEIARGLF